MVIALMGESCTGKTAIVEELGKRVPIEKFAGKDYFRMAKSPSAAEETFKEYLKGKQDQKDIAVFSISELDELKFLPNNVLKIQCHAPLDVIIERFAKRIHGNMSPQVTAMLERKHGMFNEVEVDLSFDTTQYDVNFICDEILKHC